jgi:putative lipoic acid-binding regulatory protein
LKAFDVINLPSVELLEMRHSFPCAYTFKVIGYADDNFTARVVASVRDELQIESDPPFSLRNTPHGRHVAVTLEPLCESPRQVLAIYSRLSGIDGLVMLL